MEAMTTKNGLPPKYYQLAQQIRGQIQRGQFPSDARFPTEREWMTRCKVSRFTVRQALAILEREGLLAREQGRGTFVCSAPSGSEKPAARTASVIGVLVPCAAYTDSVGIVRGIEDFCTGNGYHLLLSNYDVKPGKERDCLERLTENGVSGFVVFPSYNSSENGYYAELERREIPLVFVDSGVPGVAADVVATDSHRGAYQGMKALLASGRRKAGFLSGLYAAATSRERLAGCRRAVEEQGLAFGEGCVIEGDFTKEFGYKAAKELLSAREDLDGLFVANEPITVGVLKAVRELGRRLPEDLGIATFDEPHYSLDYLFPMILVRQPRYETGRRAAEILLERIEDRAEGRKRATFREVLLQAEIVVPAEYSRRGDESEGAARR